jgi:sugar-specific transcriptional regulator TrmB
MILADALMKTGLTRHESELYVALNREGEVTGYELAKITGIPRANVYQALAALADKGGARVIEGNPQKYVAVSPGEYCANKAREMQETLRIIRAEAPELRTPPEGYVTISGHQNILNKMCYVIGHASQRVYISMMADELRLVRDDLAEAVQKGLKVVIITSEGVPIQGAITHTIQKKHGQIRLIADSKEVLTGELTGSDQDVCLYSKNRPLIDLIKESLQNEILLAGKG